MPTATTPATGFWVTVGRCDLLALDLAVDLGHLVGDDLGAGGAGLERLGLAARRGVESFFVVTGAAMASVALTCAGGDALDGDLEAGGHGGGRGRASRGRRRPS